MFDTLTATQPQGHGQGQRVWTSRRRAPRACASCRARKVRCDVSQKGGSCTNCDLDKKTCVVLQRRAHSQRKPRSPAFDGLHSWFTDHQSPSSTINHLQTPPSEPLWIPNEDAAAANGDVVFSCYRFLCISNMQEIAIHDMNFMESQGCLQVPERSNLDELMQLYFHHVHPMLPVLDEKDFWNMYHPPDPELPCPQISLVLFQAMLYAACDYASDSLAQALGFSSLQDARKIFYRRCKLLYDFETESSPLALAQTCILLAYCSPQFSISPCRQNLRWLSSAIHHAKSVRAHVEASSAPVSPKASPIQWKKQNIMRRLWWCCVMCDRFLSLNLRTGLQISRDQFDIDASLAFGYTDLAHELGHSEVYDVENKRRLIEILEQTAELCRSLTDVITLAYPADGKTGFEDLRRSIPRMDGLKQCRDALSAWHHRATSLLPPCSRGSIPQSDVAHLQTHVMYVHYHSASAALCHYEVSIRLFGHSSSPLLYGNNGDGLRSLRELSIDIQVAASGIAASLRCLADLGLLQNLPATSLACTALPLLLTAVNVKLSANVASSRVNERRHLWHLLPAAFKSQRLQNSNDIEHIIKTVQALVDPSQIGCASTPESFCSSSRQPISVTEETSPSDWTELLISEPGKYLRLISALDSNLNHGQGHEEALSHYFWMLQHSRAFDSVSPPSMCHRDLAMTPISVSITAQDPVIPRSALDASQHDFPWMGGLDILDEGVSETPVSQGNLSAEAQVAWIPDYLDTPETLTPPQGFGSPVQVFEQDVLNSQATPGDDVAPIEEETSDWLRDQG